MEPDNENIAESGRESEGSSVLVEKEEPPMPRSDQPKGELTNVENRGGCEGDSQHTVSGTYEGSETGT